MRAGADVPVIVVGGGACGLVAALAVRDAGQDVLVLERDRTPLGSTSMSSGFVPAAGTRFQRALGLLDTPELFAADILKKADGTADPVAAARVTTAIGPALEWLDADHGVPFQVLQGFSYPGHSRLRMHAVPERTGAALQSRLLAAAEAAQATIMTGAHVTALFAEGSAVHGVRITRPDGAIEDVGCGAVVLACNGYGGDPALVRARIPELADAPYFGHAGNQGDALRWGAALGADLRDLSSGQGHGSIAHPHGIQITWALMTGGGIQVNRHGVRFQNEQAGYSEAAVPVLQQPDGVAWVVYDARLHALGRTFEDYRLADRAGAVRTAPDAAGLARETGIDGALVQTLEAVRHLAERGGCDAFGRVWDTPALQPPFYAIRVTGALLHTQGGLRVDARARVMAVDGTALPNLFAGGGAARGVSGSTIAGYLSGNGLLTAVAYGRLAGRFAAEHVT